VTGIKSVGEKRLVVISGRSHPVLAEAVAKELETSLLPVDARTFASGEIYTRMEESVRGCDAFVIQSYSGPVNEWLVEQLIMIDTLKRASAKRITAVMPYYPYSRQDKKSRGRDPISARLVADLFKTAGADRIITVDLHAAQIQGFFDGPLDQLFAMPVLVEHVQRTVDPSNLIVVSPDMGRVRVADIWSDTLDVPLAIIHKRRDPAVPNQVTVHEIVGDIRGKMCLLVDDMIDTGGTIVKGAEALKANGATGVIVAATHAIFSDPAAERLSSSSAIDRVIVTDTLPLPKEKLFDKLEVLSMAPTIAQAIHEVFEDGSVTSMFNGAA
jgi:ribose-phosphate pyrophosphokinase